MPLMGSQQMDLHILPFDNGLNSAWARNIVDSLVVVVTVEATHFENMGTTGDDHDFFTIPYERRVEENYAPPLGKNYEQTKAPFVDN